LSQAVGGFEPHRGIEGAQRFGYKPPAPFSLWFDFRLRSLFGFISAAGRGLRVEPRRESRP